MTTTSERPAPTGTAPSTTSVRPRWFTDPVLERLLAHVSRSEDNGAEPVTPVAPYDGLPTATIPASTPDDVATAVARARAAQQSWALVPYATRAEVVLRFHDLLLEQQDQVIDLIQWEMGKNRFSAWQEILQRRAFA